MKVRKQYRPKDVSYASEEVPVTSSAAGRFSTRLAQFNKVVINLRQTAFYAGQLEQSSLTRRERDEHARLAAWSDACLKQLLNFSELGQRLRGAIRSSPSAKDARLSKASILKGGSEYAAEEKSCE